MITTLVVLNIYKHGQPALLYLVPGVLIALWGTAFAKGDLALMWGYTEDGSLAEGGPETGAGLTEEEKKAKSEEVEAKQKEKAKEREKEHAKHVILFSLEQPGRGTMGHAATKTE